MKKLLTIIACVIAIPLLSSGQVLLALKKDEVVSVFYEKNKDVKYTTEWNKTQGGIDYVLFNKTELNVANAYYFNSNGYCDYMRVFYQYDDMNTVVEYLNRKFVKTSDESWVDYDKYFDTEYRISRNEHSFTVNCSIVRFHNDDK